MIKFIENRCFHKNLLWLMLLGLCVRLGFLIGFPDQNFPDAQAYVEDGLSLFKTGLMRRENYMPLYGIVTYLLKTPLNVKLFDIILSTLSIGLMALITRHIFRSSLAALLAGALAVLYPHFIFFATSRLTETSYTFLLLLGFFFLYEQKFKRGLFTLTLSILIRPTLEPFLPILLWIFAIHTHRLGYKLFFKYMGILGLFYVVLMTPWWMHNYKYYGRFVRLNTGYGLVLYSGNNPLNKTGGGIDGPDVDFSSFRHIANMADRDEAMKRAAYTFIKENPKRFIELAGLKFLRFWRLWPHHEHYAKWQLILISLLSYGLVLALSLGFLFTQTHKFWRPLLPIYTFIGFLSAVHMITIGSIRYRFPLEPFLICFAGFMLSLLFKRRKT